MKRQLINEADVLTFTDENSGEKRIHMSIVEKPFLLEKLR